MLKYRKRVNQNRFALFICFYIIQYNSCNLRKIKVCKFLYNLKRYSKSPRTIEKYVKDKIIKKFSTKYDQFVEMQGNKALKDLLFKVELYVINVYKT